MTPMEPSNNHESTTHKTKDRLGLQLLFVTFIAVLMLLVPFHEGYLAEKEAYIQENTSSTGVVVEKTCNTVTGHKRYVRTPYTQFMITIERQTINIKGETVMEQEDVLVPYDDWLQIQEGDIVTYNEDGTYTIGPLEKTKEA